VAAMHRSLIEGKKNCQSPRRRRSLGWPQAKLAGPFR
jgi:hypothetical protein